ncbi:MAG: transposase, partial [Candidatus Dechloromonas phosphoritropha]
DSVREHVKDARLLIDAWFMRKSLILPLLEQRVRIIGQVRRDTALFLPPEPEPKRRGRKRKYGRRIDATMLDALPMTEMKLTLYGKSQRVRLRSVIAIARFLKGLPVRAVWCEMHQDDGTWSRPRLILATETGLTAQDVVEIYAERWGIEPLFHNLKRWWGVANLWQQSKPLLELWMQIRCTAYALMQLLALKLWGAFPLMEIAPWRKGATITAGLFGQWMRIQFVGLRVRSALDPKSGNFVMPSPGQDQRWQC